MAFRTWVRRRGQWYHSRLAGIGNRQEVKGDSEHHARGANTGPWASKERALTMARWPGGWPRRGKRQAPRGGDTQTGFSVAGRGVKAKWTLWPLQTKLPVVLWDPDLHGHILSAPLFLQAPHPS